MAAANRRPGQTYSEGSQYPRARPNVSLKLGPRAGATRGVKLKHLAVNTVRVTPKSSVGKGWKLQITVDMGPKTTQPAAMVTIIGESGKGSTKRVALRPDGRGALKVPFAARSIRYVEVTLVNASARFKCWQRTVFSCQGRPLDNAVPAKLQVRTTR